MIRVVVDVGVSERVPGSDPWVFVLLNDDVEPPVDVDWRCNFDEGEIVGLNDERRTVDSIGLGCVFVVERFDEVGRRATGRCVRDWIFVVVFVGTNGAVTGRTLVELVFPFDDDNDVFVTDCFTREEATWDITPITGVVACNNTQTYTQMCTRF